MLTIFLFLVLIVAFVAMFGVVRFAENVIAKPQFAPLAGDAKAPAGGVKSL